MMPLDEVTEESEQAEASEIERMCQKLTVGLAKLSSAPPQQQQQQQQSFVNGDHKVRLRHLEMKCNSGKNHYNIAH